MDGMFGGLKKFLAVKAIKIDDFFFRIHYRATFVILLAASLLVTAKSYFGSPISCVSQDDIPGKLLNTYCWIHTTFSVESAWKKEIDLEVPYPGVAKYTPNEKKKHHPYYQWVCFVLFFQALAFYVPRKLWKAAEGGLIGQLIKGIDNEKTKDSVRRRLVEYMIESRIYHNNRLWFYILAEVLNTANVIIQMVIMNEFLNKEFTDYGLQVLQFTEWDWSIRYDPMLRVFPRMTKCTFRRYGSSGDVQKHDAFCLLPINIVNEKIYVFLWFWFYFVAVVSCVGLLYRLVTVLVPRVRQLATYTHRRMSNTITREKFESIVRNSSVGTWFFFHLLYKNVDSSTFKEVVVDYNKALESQQ